MKLLILILGLLNSISHQPISKCSLVGEVVDYQGDTLLLYKATDFNDLIAKIPVVDGKFRYEFPFKHHEGYELVFQDERRRGSMKIFDFFAEDGEIEFAMKKPYRSDEYMVSGGDFNMELQQYKKVILSFWDKVSSYSDSMEVLANDPLLRDEWQRLKEVQDSISREWKNWESQFSQSNTSLIAYHKMMQDYKRGFSYCCWGKVDSDVISNADRNLSRFKAMFPNHPYETIISKSIEERRNVNAEGTFADFQLTTSGNKDVKVSEVVAENKLTLLNFWSKYCGTCLEKNQEFIPIYSKYKTDGFEILGITENYKDVEGLIQFINQEDYPWQDLIDYDGKSEVRKTYSVSQTGGAGFLVDSKGKILGVNLSKDQLIAQIEDHLR